MDAKQCLTPQNDFYFSNSVVCMSVSGKLSEVLEMGLPGLVIFFFFKAKRKERKECKRRLIYINWHVLFWPTESTPQTFPVYFTLVLSQNGAFWPQIFNPDSNYILHSVLCKLHPMFSRCRRKKKDLDVLEMPSIPNPFPELCCSPFTSVLSAGLFPKANSRKKQVCILKCSN